MTGYCLQIVPFFGKETYHAYYKNLDELILYFMKDYQNKNVNVYMDNYYAHPNLFMKLKEMDINSTGTFRINRKDIPKMIKGNKIKNKKSIKKVLYYSLGNELFALKWFDKREVRLLTTNEDLRFSERRNKKGEIVQKPEAIFQYIKYMGGVDQLNQKTSFIK